MIIGISGKIGSGKDTVGKIIQYLDIDSIAHNISPTNWTPQQLLSNVLSLDGNSKWMVKRFAGKLKKIVSLLTGIAIQDLEKQEVKDTVLGKEWNYQYVHDITGEKLEGITESYTVRKLLQRIGTEAMRNVIHPNVWVNALFADYREIKRNFGFGNMAFSLGLKTPYSEEEKNKVIELGTKAGYVYRSTDESFVKVDRPKWIITDVRFPNEAEAIKQRGGILIRVNRYPKFVMFSSAIGLSREVPFNPDDKVHMDLYKGESMRQHPSENALDDYQFNYVIDNNGTIEELVVKVKEILIKEKVI